MKKIGFIIIALIALFISNSSNAQEFFDTEHPEKFFNLGARVGFNTSNRIFPKASYLNNISTTWGTGFNAGVVANLNIRNYLSIQPGFFYESRSGNMFNLAKDIIALDLKRHTYFEKSHLRAYYFTIPVMGIVKFNLAENIVWNVEFGPYIQFKLKENGQKDVVIYYSQANTIFDNSFTAKNNSFDFGFKMGSGLTLYQHYYVGFHYLAGVCNTWSHPSGGKNRSWMFTAGYDF